MFAEYLSPLKSGGLAVGKVSFCKDLFRICDYCPRICRILAGGSDRPPPLYPMAIRKLILITWAASSAAHSALTHPEPRNAIDGHEAPWGRPVPHPLPFEPWCPIPSASATKDDRNLTGSNGQACFWFSNGCAIGCDECDGSTRGPVPSFHCTEEKCTPTGEPIEFGPQAPICGPKAPAPRAKGPSMNATICDPAQRTVNTAAKCGSPEDFFYYSPWRAPGYAPVIDSCGVAGGRIPGQGPGRFGAEYVNTTHSKLGDMGSMALPPRDTGVTWVAGTEVEVAWTLQANHGGGCASRCFEPCLPSALCCLRC